MHDGIFCMLGKGNPTTMTYLKLITPLNIAEEKQRFLSSKTYSPQFEYNWDAELIERFRIAKPELITLIDALLAQNKVAIEEAASKYFDVTFRAQDILFAEGLVKKVPQATNGTADQLAPLLERKLRELGIDYGVEVVDKHGFQCRPDHKAKVIRISKYLHLQFYSTEGVANHELVHIIRAVNGTFNGIPTAPDYLPTEEGLAILVQDKLLRSPLASSFQHALEYLAAHMSREVGFREIYSFLREHGCDAENAWLRGIRQKFGLRDTSQPGGLMKSGMYFYHEQLLRELSEHELVRLFVGKISLAQLPNYKSYTGAVPQEKIEAFIKVR